MHFLEPNSHLPKESTNFGVDFQVLQADENPEGMAVPDGYSVNLKRALEASQITLATSDSCKNRKVEVSTVGCRGGGTANISSEMLLRSATVRSKISERRKVLHPFDDPYPSDDE